MAPAPIPPAPLLDNTPKARVPKKRHSKRTCLADDFDLADSLRTSWDDDEGATEIQCSESKKEIQDSGTDVQNLFKCPNDAVPAKLDSPEAFWDSAFDSIMSAMRQVHRTEPAANNALHIAQYVLQLPLPPQVNCSTVQPATDPSQPDARLKWFQNKLLEQCVVQYQVVEGHDPSQEDIAKCFANCQQATLPSMTGEAADRVDRLRDYHAFECLPKDLDTVMTPSQVGPGDASTSELNTRAPAKLPTSQTTSKRDVGQLDFGAVVAKARARAHKQIHLMNPQ